METYTLKYPITVDGETVETVDIRRPKVGDSLAIEKLPKKGEMAQSIHLTSRLTGLTEKAVAEIDAEDFLEIVNIIEEMTGGKSQAGTA